MGGGGGYVSGGGAGVRVVWKLEVLGIGQNTQTLSVQS